MWIQSAASCHQTKQLKAPTASAQGLRSDSAARIEYRVTTGILSPKTCFCNGIYFHFTPPLNIRTGFTVSLQVQEISWTSRDKVCRRQRSLTCELKHKSQVTFFLVCIKTNSRGEFGPDFKLRSCTLVLTSSTEQSPSWEHNRSPSI